MGGTVSDAALTLAAVDPCYCCTERAVVGFSLDRLERTLKDADGQAKAEVYSALGLHLTYRPNQRQVDVIAAPKAVDVSACRRTVRERHYTTCTAASLVRYPAQLTRQIAPSPERAIPMLTPRDDVCGPAMVSVSLLVK